MTTVDLKEQITQKLNHLSPRLLSVVNDLINALTVELGETPQAPDSRPEETSSNSNAEIDDSLIGMFKGSPDLATNAENILREETETGSRRSWRQ
ncbi:MAG: hypothetical protein ACFB0D_18065 [Phormidesmis sp.]